MDSSIFHNMGRYVCHASMTTELPLTKRTDELLTHPSFKDYQLRTTQPDLCDPHVQQYSGYLDISDEKHLFFW